MDTTTPRLIPVPEARKLLGGIGHTMIYDLINRGDIVRVKIGARAFITSGSLAAYIGRLEATAKAPEGAA